jgi:hypothetical protein
MSIKNPQVLHVLKTNEEQNDQHFLYVTTHFNHTNYHYDGYEEVPDPDGDTLTVTLKVKKDGLPLRLNKAVFHQVPISSSCFPDVTKFNVIVKEDTIQLAVIVYQEESQTDVRPIRI